VATTTTTTQKLEIVYGFVSLHRLIVTSSWNEHWFIHDRVLVVAAHCTCNNPPWVFLFCQIEDLALYGFGYDRFRFLIVLIVVIVVQSFGSCASCCIAVSSCDHICNLNVVIHVSGSEFGCFRLHIRIGGPQRI
jgi:hypothetical protein